MTKVLIAEDHQFIISALKMMFKSRDDIEVVGEVTAPNDVLAAYTDLKPDVVVLDISFRGYDQTGLDVIKELKSFDPNTRIVILSQHDQEMVIKDAYRFGALAYVLKNDANQAIFPAIDAAMSGELYYSPEVSAKLAGLQISGSSFEQLLTKEEVEYFKRFAVLEKVESISEEMKVAPRTVRAIRSRIKEKLGIETEFELLKKAKEFGLLDTL